MKLSHTQHILEVMLKTPVSILTDIRSQLEDFEKAHCFSTEAQHMYTTSYLRHFIQTIEKKTIYEIHELETIVMMFYLNEELVIIGPYVSKGWDTRESAALLVGLRISASHLIPYRQYRLRYSLLETEVVLKAAGLLIESAGLNMSDYDIQKVNKVWERMDVNTISPMDNYTFEYVTQRYAIEREFMAMIREGDAIKTKACLKQLTSAREGLSYVTSPSFNSNIGATILRILIRVAAGQSGLDPIIIDAITQKYSQRLYAPMGFLSKQRIDEMTYSMIDDICYEISRMKKQKFSPVIRKAIHYIQLNLSHNIRIDQLAEELHISSGYLSKLFKNETGLSVVNYLTEERAKRAAELLETTNHSVQDISAYVGYPDSNYFIKIFKNKYGMTPTEYRKKLTI